MNTLEFCFTIGKISLMKTRMCMKTTAGQTVVQFRLSPTVSRETDEDMNEQMRKRFAVSIAVPLIPILSRDCSWAGKTTMGQHLSA